TIDFFFQAEDGIRDFHVTGVQTCALPISPIVEGALKARSILISSPLEIPPSIPPKCLESELTSLPFIWAMVKPEPRLKPTQAGIESMALARSAFNLSKTGSPKPAGTPVMESLTIPPADSPLLLQSCRKLMTSLVRVLSGILISPRGVP